MVNFKKKENQKTLADEKAKQDPKDVANTTPKIPKLDTKIAMVIVDKTNDEGKRVKEFRQRGVVYNEKHEPIGSYNMLEGKIVVGSIEEYKAPKPEAIDPISKKIVKAPPLDGNGNPRLVLNNKDFPLIMVVDTGGNRTFKQHGCIYDGKGNFKGRIPTE